MTNKEIFDTINAKILESLENNIIPWKKPWNGGESMFPVNHATKKHYQGINTWLLLIDAEKMGYTSNQWIGFGQADKLGIKVNKGAKASTIYLWTSFDKEETDDTGETTKRKIWYMKPLKVFNISSCSNVPTNYKPKEHNPIVECEKVIETYKTRENIQITVTNSARAYYSITSDSIIVPTKEQYESVEQYYSTMFHEISHSTGAKNRLDREFGLSFGNDAYAFEELVAELSASYLCGINSIDNATIDNSAAYINGWKSKLKDNKEWFVKAASKAQKASNFVLTGAKGMGGTENE